MQQKMLRTSMATNLEHRRLLQEGAAACGGSLVPFSGTVLAAASHRFAIGEHDVVLDGKPLPIRCDEMHCAPVRRESTPETCWTRTTFRPAPECDSYRARQLTEALPKND
jgi:hypothetical protein